MGRPKRVFVADFETTVYPGQIRTDVWASACVELNTEDVHIFHTIEEQFNYFKSLKSEIIVYFHNLKFDGTFILSYFMNNLHLAQAIEKIGPRDNDIEFVSVKEMKNNTFTYSISGYTCLFSLLITANINPGVMSFIITLPLPSL